MRSQCKKEGWATIRGAAGGGGNKKGLGASPWRRKCKPVTPGTFHTYHREAGNILYLNMVCQRKLHEKKMLKHWEASFTYSSEKARDRDSRETKGDVKDYFEGTIT